MPKPIALARTIVALGLLAAGPASASGFLVARFGGELGHPTTDSLTAMYYNPAGLALSPGRLRIYAEGLFAYRTASYERPAAAIDNPIAQGMSGTGTPADATAANAGKATLFNPIVTPFVGVASDFGVPGLAVGASFYAPFGGQATWDKNEAFRDSARYPGAVDGVQRWATIDGIIRSLYGTVTAAYRLPRQRLSIGLSGNAVYSQVETIRARNANGTDDLVTSSGALQEGRSLIMVSGLTFSVAAGVIWQPTDTSWIGLSYQSQPGFGETTLSGTLQNKLGLGAASESKVEMTQTLPDVIRLGGRWRVAPKLELRLFGEYVRWSVLVRQCVLDASNPSRACAINTDGSAAASANGSVLVNLQREWQDAFGVRAGASYFVSPAVELFLGAGYDSNAVPDKTLDPSLMDMNKVTVSGGGRFGLWRDRLMLNLTYLQVIYFEREVAKRTTTPAPPSRSPDMAGKYNQSVGSLIVGLEYRY